MRKYSAGIVSKGFWFIEFKKYVENSSKGFVKSDILSMQLEDNIFYAPSENYGRRIIGEVSKRYNSLSLRLITIFLDSDIKTQKIINLISIMMNDLLFFEFIYYVYRYKIVVGDLDYSQKNPLEFLNEKSIQDSQVAKFTQQSIKRMSTAYTTYLKEAGLIEEKDGRLLITNVVCSYELELYLQSSKLKIYYDAIKGVNL